MNKISLALHSRTFLTIVVIIGLNTLPQVKDILPQGVYNVLNPILGLLATYFHVKPHQDYGYTPYVGVHKDNDPIDPPTEL